MSTVPNRFNLELVLAAIAALLVFEPTNPQQAADMLLFWVRRVEMTAADLAEVQRRMFPRAACPEWCTFDHTDDDVRDDLVLHQGDDYTDGTVRKLLDAHTLDVRIARTDCPSEERAGVPALMVRLDVELTTWEQAAELARTILDGFGYLSPAGK